MGLLITQVSVVSSHGLRLALLFVAPGKSASWSPELSSASPLSSPLLTHIKTAEPRFTGEGCDFQETERHNPFDRRDVTSTNSQVVLKMSPKSRRMLVVSKKPKKAPGSIRSSGVSGVDAHRRAGFQLYYSLKGGMG